MKRLIVLFMLIAATAHGQNKPMYTAGVEAGWLRGNNGSSMAYFLSNGIRYKTVSAGVGIGTDNYFIRSVPLFLDIRKDFGHHRFQPYVSYAAGINISAIKDGQKQTYAGYQNYNVNNGFFMKASAGASLAVYKKIRFYTGFGYSYKTTRTQYDTYSYYPEQTSRKGTDIRRMNRWNIVAGFRF